VASIVDKMRQNHPCLLLVIFFFFVTYPLSFFFIFQHKILKTTYTNVWTVILHSKCFWCFSGPWTAVLCTYIVPSVQICYMEITDKCYCFYPVQYLWPRRIFKFLTRLAMNTFVIASTVVRHWSLNSQHDIIVQKLLLQ